MIRTAFSSMALFDRPIREVAEAAVDMGYDGVELRCTKGGHLHDEMSLTEVREISKIFADHGIRVFSVSGYTKFTSPETQVRETNLRSLCRQVEFAHELQADSVRCLGGKVPLNEWVKDSQTYIEMLASYLGKAAEQTAGSDVDILLSTHDNFSPAAVATKVTALVDDPRVSLLWCVIHPLQFGEDVATTWQHIQGKFRLVHFKDALRGELYQWWPLRRLGAGELPLTVIARLLKETRYDGVLSIEWEKHVHSEIEDSEPVLQHGLDYLRKRFQIEE